MTDLEFFESLELLKGASKETIKEFPKIVKKKDLPKGTVIVREGEEGDSMFILRQGEVEVSMSITLPVSGKGREKVLVSLKPGSIFGEMAFVFGKEQRSATVVAKTNVVVYEIASRDFEQFINANPQDGVFIFRNIAKIIANRLRKANRDIAKLTTVLSVVLDRMERSS